MISFELAKQLKDAGFPQNTNMKCYHPTHGVAFGLPHPGTLIDPDVVSIPTLSELIEACGDGFKGLFPPTPRISDCWFAVKKVGQINKEGIFVEWSLFGGHTPEEAVARLWLELNKK